MATGTALELPTRRERLWRFLVRVRASRSAMLGLGMLVPIVLASVLSPWISPYDPTAIEPTNQYAAPSVDHLFGTDHYGRDLLSRTLVGGRSSLLVGVAATALTLLLGVPIGIVAGYFGGRVDEVLMRIMDVFLGIPALILALLMVVALSPSLWNVALAVGIVSTPSMARIIRSRTLSIKENEFVEAAEARGESSVYVLFWEILPNTVDVVVIEGSIRVGFAILLATSLSFLGMGTQPPAADWGYMISVAREHIGNTPYYLLWPSIALSLTIVGFNLLGEGLRDVLDPQLAEENR
jgi:peptide/nickel transport system permease protein